MFAASHIEFWPLETWCQKMSDLPSPSKSATLATRHAWSGTVIRRRWSRRVAGQPQSIHPRALVTPEDVGSAIAIEIANTDDFPAWSGTDLTASGVVELADFQIAFTPVTALRQRMSDRPSPSKSPTPTMVHSVSATVATACGVDGLADYQTPFGRRWNVAPQDIDLPSPSKSPTPALSSSARVRSQGLASRSSSPIARSHSGHVLKLRQRMSDLPSPSKSPVPATRQDWSGTALTACVWTDWRIARSRSIRWTCCARGCRIGHRHRSRDSVSASGTTVARNVAMIGMVRPMLRTLFDALTTPVGRPSTVTFGLAKYGTEY